MTDETQGEKFRRVARELGCDEDEDRWDEVAAKVAAHRSHGDEAPKDDR